MQAEVTAFQCDFIEAEIAGISTGLAGQSFTARRPPIIAPTLDNLDLLVGVEAAPGELGERARAIQYDGKPYRIWREVENFTNLASDRFVYVADRAMGTITFAPAVQMSGQDGKLEPRPEALAEVPAAGREIRLWYRRGGGPEGNVAANTLTVLKDAIPGLQVTNRNPATGGRASETLENALMRGPQELHSLERAVTASDFELLAQRSGAVARAKAVTRAKLWAHASPGTVEVLLVPYLPEEERGAGQITVAKLTEQETEEARARIQASLDERRPLGTTCLVRWVSYKSVRVEARVVVYRGEEPGAIKRRVINRLHQTINPLPTQLNPAGWRFGQPLRASNVYDTILAEPGVSYVNRVRLLVDEVPERAVRALATDAFQPRTWYAAAEQTLFRSTNNGDGWEPVGRFAGEDVDTVRANPKAAGMLAVATRVTGEGGGSRIHISTDCGENWREVAQMAFNVEDVAWIMREGVPVLLFATEVGLYEMDTRPGASPVQILVEAQNQDLGFYAIAVSPAVRGVVSVAVAARGAGGIYLSKHGGKPATFANTGLRGEDVRVLEVQQEGVRSFLWAGVAAGGNEPGRGCHRRELIGEEDPPDGWQPFQKGWTGGSCRSLAFQGLKVLAATHRAGVVWLDSGKSDAAWQMPPIGCGLPIRDAERLFHPASAVAANAAANAEDGLILVGGPEGVYRSQDKGLGYESCSSKIFTDKVMLPETWLFCSGEHDITVVSEDEADRD
jgi:hypothetical protein